MWDARTAAILVVLGRGPERFSSLRAAVPNPRTLSRRLHRLVEAGWVAHDRGIYRLTEQGARGGELVRQLDALQGPRFAPVSVDRVPSPRFAPIVRWAVERLRGRLPARLAGVLVFGSVARGQESPDSDIDLLVLVRGDARALEEVRRGVLQVQRELRSTSEYRVARHAGFHPVLDAHLVLVERAYRLYRLYLDALTDGIPVYDPERQLAELRERMRARLRAAGSVRVETSEGFRYWKLGDPEILGAPI